jgi:hypothetical protein
MEAAALITSNELLDELAAKKKECDVAGCMDDCVKIPDCVKRHEDLKNCMGGIKNTMQVKTNVMWEIVKVIAIPLATAGIIYWGAFSSLRTEVTIIADTVKSLNVMVIDLIKDKR